MKRALLLAAALIACGKHSGTVLDPGGVAGDPGSGSGGSSGSGSGGSVGTGFAGAGPWGAGNRQYDSDSGILEQPVVGASTDEAQNLWVATNAALYLLKPGQTTFKRYAAAAGLHLPGNAVTYCDSNFAGGDKKCPISGAAASPGISEITGGSAGEVFVGYYGLDDGSADWGDPNRHSGKLDRVRLQADGSLKVDRIDFVSSDTPEFWHNRTVQRLLYDHFQHAHELYVGTNHGVDRILPDKLRAPAQGEWFLKAYAEYVSDHLHPQVCYHHACDASESDLRLGDWKGLALSKDGNLWVAGRWTAGQIRWTASLNDWLARPGDQIFSIAFGDGYVKGKCNSEGFCNQPVFMVDAEGDVISAQAAAVAPDGKVWFASGKTTSQDVPRGLAVWDPAARNFRYFDPVLDAGMVERDLRDLVALPDGRLVLAGATSGLTFWDPATGRHVAVSGSAFMPDDHVFRLELDQMVSPPTLYVSTWGGVAALRKLP